MPAPPSKRADSCPCGTGVSYALCRQRYHRGEREAPDAEALMRSRYAAFAKAQTDYLWRTLHPDHPDRAAPEAAGLASIRRMCERVRYMGLTVLDRTAPDPDGVARVLFVARLFERGRDVGFMEASDFAHDGTGWRYLAGEALPLSAVTGDPATVTLGTFTARTAARAR